MKPIQSGSMPAPAAELAENVDENFAELRSFHDATPLFRTPKGWGP